MTTNEITEYDDYSMEALIEGIRAAADVKGLTYNEDTEEQFDALYGEADTLARDAVAALEGTAGRPTGLTADEAAAIVSGVAYALTTLRLQEVK